MGRSLPANHARVSHFAPLLIFSLVISQAQADDSLRGWAAPVPSADRQGEREENWVDSSHAYVTENAQALSEWMDQFFGDENYNQEQAESLLRLQFVNGWDSDQGYDPRLRLQGKLQLPRISRRLDLVFSDQAQDDEDLDDDRLDDRVGLQYLLREGKRSRFDTTLGLTSSGLKPGVKYRNRGDIVDEASYRFIQRIQHEQDEGFYGTTQLDFNYKQDADTVWRWSQRGLWGEKSKGVEWRSRLALRQRHLLESKRPLAVEHFLLVDGVTRPDAFVRNYRLGTVFRRQVYRPYMFVEIEPSYSFLKPDASSGRDGEWGIVLRLEFALQRDLALGSGESMETDD
ncbi:MAG: hypothetical protein ABR578_05620 [Chromatocurvus sp.]